MVSEIASRLDRDEKDIQQQISEKQLQRIVWTKENDDLLESLWRQDVLAKDIGYQLDQRSNIAVCIRASQLGLRRRDFEASGTSYTSGAWTQTGDTYLSKGVEAGLSDDGIQAQYFPNTRTVKAIESRRRGLQNPESAANSSQEDSGSTTTLQSDSALQSYQIKRPAQRIREVYMQAMIYHTNMSDGVRTEILNLIDSLEWPTKVHAENEIGAGSLSGLESAWSDVDNQLLRVLRGVHKMERKEIADAFFMDRVEEELETQLKILQAGHHPNDAVLVE